MKSSPHRLARLLPALLAALLAGLGGGPLSAAALQQPGASGGVLIPEEAAYDVLSYDLEIEVDPQQRAIRGRLAMQATLVQPARRIALDLDEHLTVDEVQVNGERATARHKDGRIWIELGKLTPGETGTTEFIVVVRYHGKPRVAPQPPWDGGFTWSHTRDGRPWIATSCQGEGADLWWPCKDHPSDKPDHMALHVTVPEGLVCASNGVLEQQTTTDGKTTFDWSISSPISNYAVALNIAPYELLETTCESVGGGSFPVQFYVLPENLEKGKAFLPEILDHLHHLESVCGPYPFREQKYGAVETPHLGMEHQTIVAYGNRYRPDHFGYDWLHYHELAHEWWGNLVTCRDWKDMWLHEGFATYMQALYVEHKHGLTGYRKFIAEQRAGLNNRRAVAPRETQDSKQIYFGPDGAHDNDIYNKGACVLHTLRWALGDEAFFQSLRRFAYPDPADEAAGRPVHCRLVDTEDYRALVEKIAGRDMAWFFEVYLRQPKLPALSVTRKGGVLQLAWRVPGGEAFPMPVPVRVGGEIRRVEMPGGKAELALPAGKDYVIDPDGWLLRE